METDENVDLVEESEVESIQCEDVGKLELGVAETDVDLKKDSRRILLYKIAVQLLYSLTYVNFGVFIAQTGATITVFEDLLGLEDYQTGLILSVRGMGFLAGAFVSGITFDLCKGKRGWFQITVHKMLALNNFILVVVTFLLPIVKNFAFLCGLVFMHGFLGSTIDVFCNTLCLMVWGKNSNWIMQTMHFSFSIGALLSPLLVSLIFKIWEDSHQSVPLRISYWISCVFLMPSVIGFVLPSPVVKEKNADNKDELSAMSRKDRIIYKIKAAFSKTQLRKTVIYWSCAIILFASVGCEVAVGSLITKFAKDTKLVETVSQAAGLSSLFWGGLGVGRFLGIFVAFCLSPSTMLGIALLGTIFLAVVSLLIGRILILVQITVFIFGAFNGVTYPSTVSYPQTNLDAPPDGFLSSSLVFGASLGEAVVPLVISGLWFVDPIVLYWVVLAFLSLAFIIWIFDELLFNKSSKLFFIKRIFRRRSNNEYLQQQEMVTEMVEEEFTTEDHQNSPIEIDPETLTEIDLEMD